VLTEGISEDAKKKLGTICEQYDNVEICIHVLNNQIIAALPTTEQFTKATYNRFFLTKILSGDVQKILYLDADIICVGSLSDLLITEFGDNVVAVVEDEKTVANYQIKALGLKDKYFNAGFILMDIEKWEENCISEKAIAFSFDNLGKLGFLDQDALNVVLTDKKKIIDRKYDFIIKRYEELDELPSSTVFFHYTGMKPWKECFMYPIRKYFLTYKKMSPWKDVPLIPPQNYKEMKAMARGCRRYDSLLTSMTWYVKYCMNKINERYL
jgi:lipopolysaccharide biosynthesis glycosyltransferase